MDHWQIPGISSTKFIKKKGYLGSVIEVLNNDGSKHIEEVIEFKE